MAKTLLINKTLIINSGIGEIRVALLDGDTPSQLFLHRAHEPSLLGQEFFARVTKISSEMDGAFLDIGGQQAFLPKRGVSASSAQKKKPVNTLLHEGQMICVKISRDAIPHDNKLAMATQVKTEHMAKEPSAVEKGSYFISWLMKLTSHDQISEIIIDDLSLLAKIKKQLAGDKPALTPFKEKEPLFIHFGVEDKITEVIENKIPLPSGGWITIEGTHALTAIDVNGGGAGGGRIAPDSALKTNLEAAKTIAQALVFQNIGGLVVIDFIDMLGKAAKATLDGAMKKALSNDHLHVECGALSPFGLFEVKRQRQGESLRERLVKPEGGMRDDAAALELLRQAKRNALSPGTGDIEIKAPAPVITWLQNHPQLCNKLRAESARNITLTAEG